MPDDRPAPELTEAERQARALAALLDAAADELERAGPVPPQPSCERRLAALEAAWAGEGKDTMPRNEAGAPVPLNGVAGSAWRPAGESLPAGGG